VENQEIRGSNFEVQIVKSVLHEKLDRKLAEELDARSKIIEEQRLAALKAKQLRAQKKAEREAEKLRL
jgi:hypothetical protein